MLGVCNHRTMEAKSRMILEKYCSEYLWNMEAIPIEKLIEAIGIDIEYQHITKDGQKILGKLICTDGVTPYYDMDQQKYLFLEVHANTIIIEARLLEQESQGRYRFTLAHELAHWILHKEDIISAQNEAAYIDGAHNNKMENQADYFASALLMPLPVIKKYYYTLNGKGYNKFELIADMSERFNVSKQAMQIKLESHNIID